MVFLPYIDMNQPWVYMCLPTLKTPPISLLIPSLWVVPVHWLWVESTWTQIYMKPSALFHASILAWSSISHMVMHHILSDQLPLLYMGLFLDSIILCMIYMYVISPVLCCQISIIFWKNSLLNSFKSVQLLSHVRLFATAWTAACQTSLSITNSRSLLKLMSIKSVMTSNCLILCCPLLLLPSIFPSIRVFSNESVLCIRWPKYCSFSISPSNEYSGLIPFRID